MFFKIVGPITDLETIASGSKDQTNLGSAMKRTDPHFVVCIKNRGYAASLELRKLYRVKPDEGAEKAGMVRVIDESGEDYVYPKEYFLPVQLPQTTEKAVLRASSVR